jgi:hypothetical protein
MLVTIHFNICYCPIFVITIKIHKMLPIKLIHVIKGKTENEDSVIEKLLPQYLHIILNAMAAYIGNSME